MSWTGWRVEERLQWDRRRHRRRTTVLLCFAFPWGRNCCSRLILHKHKLRRPGGRPRVNGNGVDIIVSSGLSQSKGMETKKKKRAAAKA